ncbi:MAG: methyl-accepting chemotaxis protein [Agathobacter sp.]|nr:methyl-accepting chemotaxis protein [Agathobacter sp.]
MKINKKLYMRTKIIVSFIILDILVLFLLWAGYSTASTIVYDPTINPERYLMSYNIFSGLILGIFLVVAGGISIVIPRQLRKSSQNLINITKEIARGNMDVEIKKVYNDEFGAVIDEYVIMVENIRAQAMLAQAVANGDMTVDVIASSDVDTMGNALKTLVQRNGSALGNINDAAYQVMTSASQVASASEALAQGSTEQASAIEQITSSISEIAEKTRENASQANHAANLVNEAIQDVEKGNEEMREMVIAMEDINKSSESISKIIKVIDDIAFQTNILALNAAVEAARAGDAGKGFAVVAEEVRNLAAKSAAAASETAEMIEDSIAKVAIGSRLADETAKALEDISNAVKQSEVIINNIAESSNYQATAVAQINQGIGQVSQVVQTNSATSEECAAASEELSNQAVRMRDLLSIYKLNESAVVSRYHELEEEANTASAVDANEPVISLGEGFGKY